MGIALHTEQHDHPLGRAEYVEGQIIRGVEVEWNYIFAGFGIAYRKLLSPGHQDNALELSLTYEPGYRWFKGSGDASPNFIVPSDTYEGRVHLRLRNDALERNLMELPHRGYAFGGDFFYGHRAKWGRWGGVVFDNPNPEQQRDYMMGSVYALAAGGIPGIASQRHRIIAHFMAASGKISTDSPHFDCRGDRPVTSGRHWHCRFCRVSPSMSCFPAAMPSSMRPIGTRPCSFSIRTFVGFMDGSSRVASSLTGASAIKWTPCRRRVSAW